MKTLLGNWRNRTKCIGVYKRLYSGIRKDLYTKGKGNKENEQKETTYDVKEKNFFNDLHMEWWDTGKSSKWCDRFGRLMGSGMQSLHDYNERRFQFIFKTFEFVYYERLKRGKNVNRECDEIEVLRILDVGCGGGILCEYMKKHLYQFLVKSNMLFKNKNMESKKWDIYIDGIDVSNKLIELANRRKYETEEKEKFCQTQTNKNKNDCNIYLNYRNCDVSDLVNQNSYEKLGQHLKRSQELGDPLPRTSIFNEKVNKRQEENRIETWDVNKKKENKYDIIISSEVIEHIPNDKKEDFIKYISLLSKENTVVIFTTINRNVLSYLYSIVLAEYITGMIKRGTHEYDKFIDDEKLRSLCFNHNMVHLKTEHVIYLPLLRNYFETKKLKLLYLSAFIHKQIK